MRAVAMHLPRRARSPKMPRMPRGLLVLLVLATASHAASTVSETNEFAYGSNIGWLTAFADGANGAVLGEFACSGYLYGANVGWIHLGSGNPTNGVRYGNGEAGDYGVNLVGSQLRGFAYGANIGWINFESNGNPRVNLLTGAFEGYAYGANVGWISLSNAFAYVQATNLQVAADGDGDGIPDAWELDQVGTTNILAGGAADHDGDGVPDRNEYLADTDPDDSGDFLRITRMGVSNAVQATVAWPSRPSRLYRIDRAGAASNLLDWADSGLGAFVPDGTNTARTMGGPVGSLPFYRVWGVRPLSP